MTEETTHDTAQRPPRRYLGTRGAIALGSYLMAVGAGLLYAIYVRWPEIDPGATPGAAPFDILAVVVLLGALGSWIHAISSFVTYVGNRAFVTSWIGWYLVRPLIGAGLALVFHFVLRAGLTSLDGGPVQLSPHSVAAFAALVGLFTEKATKKLGDVFEALFPSPQKDRDALESVRHPEVRRVDPVQVTAGGDGAVVRILGSGFDRSCVVRIDGESVPIHARQEDRVTVRLDAATIAAPRELSVVVSNPLPKPRHSEAVLLRVVDVEGSDG